MTRVTGQYTSLQALRFGVNPGSRIMVERKIPGGPVIVLKDQLEIAVGPEIALAIEVVPAL